jgi:hypothetical protein
MIIRGKEAKTLKPAGGWQQPPNSGRIAVHMVTLENLRHDKKRAILNLARWHGARSIRV